MEGQECFSRPHLAPFLEAETVLGCAIESSVVGGFCAQRSNGGRNSGDAAKRGPPRELVRLSLSGPAHASLRSQMPHRPMYRGETGRFCCGCRAKPVVPDRFLDGPSKSGIPSERAALWTGSLSIETIPPFMGLSSQSRALAQRCNEPRYTFRRKG